MKTPSHGIFGSFLSARVCFCLALASASATRAASYYVDPAGSDTNSGLTISTPFQTIGKAASVVAAGDTCYIRRGTFRETVTVPVSGTSVAPITFTNYNNEPVVISGADVLSASWSVSSGSIYQATTTSSFRQLFVDGAMMNEARWPNARTNDLLEAPRATVDQNNANNDFLVDAALPAGSLVGASVHIFPGGNGWSAFTRTITAYDQVAKKISWATGWVAGNAAYAVTTGDPYYLFGALALLDIPTEWYLDDAANTVYLWTPDGASPAGHTVEFKARASAFVLDGRSYVNLTGLNIFAAGISLVNTTNCVVDNCHLRYIQHNTTAGWGTDSSIISALKLSGSGSILKNSSVMFSSQHGVELLGTGAQVSNCVISQVDYYPGSYFSAVVLTSGTGHKVLNNTLTGSGRFLVWPKATGSEIGYNDISWGDRRLLDGGGIYIYNFNGGGTTIHHNWLYNTESGVYLDNGCSNFVVHHNVSFNNSKFGIQINSPGTNHLVYNNTLIGNPTSIPPPYDNSGSPTEAGTQVINTLADHAMSFLADSTHHHNGWYPTVGANFVPQAGSGAIDGGVVLSPYTDGYVGSAPDIGAYESGAAYWTAGASFAMPAFPTPGSTSAPTAPTALAATLSGSNISLSWIASPSAVSFYNLKRATLAGGPYTVIATVPVGTTYYTDVGVYSGGAYYYAVSAVNSSGESANSTAAFINANVAWAPAASSDIGTVGTAGSASNTSGTFTVNGAGSDIGGAADSFTYVNESVTGDGTFIVRLTSQSGSTGSAKVGLMMRADLTPGAQAAAVILNNGYGATPPTARWMRRTTAGGTAAWTDGPGGQTMPRWFKLTRAGNTFTGYISADGAAWTTVGSSTVAMPSTIYVGLAVCSRNPGALNTSIFDSLISDWSNNDIGTVGLAGSGSETGGTFTVAGAGSDIGGTADSFHSTSVNRTGNTTLVARLTAGGGGSAKIGLMMRTDLTPGSPFVAIVLDSGFGTTPPTARLTSRTTAGGSATSVNGSSGFTLPQWFKLVRVSNTFTGYISPDGVTWTTVGSSSVTMPSLISVGMAVTSRTTGSLTTATFDNTGVW